MKYWYKKANYDAEIIHSEYEQAELFIANNFIKETLAIKIPEETIILNDDNIEYCVVIASKGVSLLTRVTSRHLFGLIGILVSSILGGKRQCVFIKLKNGKRLLLKVKNEYTRFIRSKRRRIKDNMNEEDLQWTRDVLNEIEVHL